MTGNDRLCRVVTCRDNRDLVLQSQKRIGGEWPEFMLHDPVAQRLAECYERLPDYQFVLTAPDGDEVVSIANSIPLRWDDDLGRLPDEGWDWALTKGLDDHSHDLKPNLLCALQIVVFGDNRGKGISRQAVKAMKAIGKSQGLSGLIAPVRPSLKCDHPDVPIDEYITWTNDDGLPFDPWLRVHAREGARIIKPCSAAMRITGTISEWESWTGLRFDTNSDYIVPGALVRVRIDLDNDLGTYIEPNVWMYHPPED